MMKYTSSRAEPPRSPTRQPFVARNNGETHRSASPPNTFYRPNTTQNEDSVYILTLNLTPSISMPMEQMRAEYFPKALNRTPAHITLFHALPFSQLSNIQADLSTIASSTRPYHVSTGRPFRMRKGVAVRLDSGAECSEHLREELRERWEKCLSEQDRRAWMPHWTVMNKVDDGAAVEKAFDTIRRVLFEEVQHGKAVGVTLWRYLPGGRWEEVHEYAFQRGRTPAAEKDTEGFFDLKTEGKARESKSPEALKTTGSKVAGMWKTVTGKGKKGSGQE
jgi:2'-5' RNA ligase